MVTKGLVFNSTFFSKKIYSGGFKHKVQPCIAIEGTHLRVF